MQAILFAWMILVSMGAQAAPCLYTSLNQIQVIDLIPNNNGYDIISKGKTIGNILIHSDSTLNLYFDESSAYSDRRIFSSASDVYDCNDQKIGKVTRKEATPSIKTFVKYSTLKSKDGENHGTRITFAGADRKIKILGILNMALHNLGMLESHTSGGGD